VSKSSSLETTRSSRTSVASTSKTCGCRLRRTGPAQLVPVEVELAVTEDIHPCPRTLHRFSKSATPIASTLAGTTTTASRRKVSGRPPSYRANSSPHRKGSSVTTTTERAPLNGVDTPTLFTVPIPGA